ALSAMAAPEAGRSVAGLITGGAPQELSEQAFSILGKRLFSEWIDLRKDPAVTGAIRKAMSDPRLQTRALELVDDLEDPVYAPELLAIAKSQSASEETRAAAIQALGRTRDPKYVPELETMMASGPLRMRVSAVRAIGYARTDGLEARFEQLILSAPNE